MSRSYTVKGSYGRQANVGRPRQQNEMRNEASGTQDLDPESASCKPPQNERYQRREAYTMFAPNEDKRKKLLEVKQREEEISRQRKEMKGKTPVRMTPKRVGGQEMSCNLVHHQQQKETNLSPTLKAIEMREKREKWRQEKRKKEEQEIQERKAAARQQAERNEKKAAYQSETVRSHWDKKYPQQSYSSAEAQESSSYYYSDYNAASNNNDENDDLEELCRMYPEYDPTSLREILLAQGSTEGVKQLLGY